MIPFTETRFVVRIIYTIECISFQPVHHAPQPYKFGYNIKDHHGEQHREESGNGGHAVRGSYGFTDARGIRREVHYVADHGGFRAQVKTNEPGTANQNPAAVHLISDAPYEHGRYAGAAGLGYAGVVSAPVGYAGLGGAGFGYAGYGASGLGYAGRYGGSGYGGLGILGGLGYERYGY
ncbi:cuticle protein 16.8 [Trichonephila clavata]|uniref:Cuticle protein 16.8 n=1 Tax=Trichonephila clavata TaxID=2740835 RepID=A0A8X6KW29_TRICU|nr:cuticle protein 16.8 [Trichonephila clavata]